MRSRVHLLAAAVMLVAACGPGASWSHADDESPAVLEYQVKAGFVFNFLKFVSWPANAETSWPDDRGRTTGAWRIGVIGKRSVVEIIAKTLAGGTIGGRPVEVSAIGENEDPTLCHVVFIEKSHTKSSASLIEMIQNSPVLVVGETPDFARTHGIIGFVKRKDNFRLEINPLRARKAGLVISGKLASLADLVEDKS